MSLSYYVIGKHKEWQKSVAKFMLLRIFGIKKRSSFECRLITLLFIWKKIEIFIITRSKTRRRWRKKEKEEHQRKCICGVSNETSHLVAAKQNTSFFSSCIPSSVSSHSALFPTFHPHLTPHCFSILYFFTPAVLSLSIIPPALFFPVYTIVHSLPSFSHCLNTSCFCFPSLIIFLPVSWYSHNASLAQASHSLN